ncbi:sensor histidine kinase [Rhizocola hellebori]|uniref:histidine kinase n=1 Tax=Rhizocola hellebori TaxID=1392758 RepID=A0A8J3QCQ6_9ACTN|nr:sensor histidine kinase [Rhizocola hellebori]
MRTKLVAAMVTLLAVAFLVVGVTTVVTLNNALYDRIDSQLRSAAGRVPTNDDQQTNCAMPRHNEFPLGQAIGTVSVRVCDGRITNADILVEKGQQEPDLTPFTSTFLGVPGGAAPRTYDLGELGPYRMVGHTKPDGAVLITGLPLAETQQTLYLLVAVIAGVTVLALISVGFAGAFIVRRTLAPLSRIASTATRVSQLRLDRGEVELAQRVADPDTDPRTEVGQVGAALNRMLDHVGSALESRHASEMQVRQFVADASHELRTPLAAIRGYAELSRRSREPVPPELAHMLRRVESEAQRMTALVEDLLLLARIDAGRKLAHGPVDLSMLVVDAVSDAHAAGPKHLWQLDLPEEPVIVTGDKTRLHQVIANLLANARTHTPEGTSVTVGVTTQGERATLTVTDTGPGIPAELLPTIFERFARGDSSRSRQDGSTGLGLAIVQAVVTAQGGTIAVDSAPGRTEFTVRLPLNKNMAQS